METLLRGKVFEDRRDAGRQLGETLARLRLERPIVLGLPRGGVIVAEEVARALGAPLDVFVARKIGAPGEPEFAVGAVAPGGVVVYDPRVIEALRISPEQLRRAAELEAAEVERRTRRFRGNRPWPELRGRTVVLVDDGLATGMTARAAIRALRQFGPGRLVLAVPVGAPETVAALRREVDDLVCLSAPEPFHAVGLWYRDFSQTTDEEVLAVLESAWRAESGEEAAHEERE